MAVTYGFYDSLNHDRLYNAQQMSAIFDGIINDGVFMSVGNQFHTVAGTGMQVIVKSGRAWFDSTWTLNDAEYPLSIDAADVLLTRIDAVVLEVNSEVATRANTIKVVKGTPASTPAKPTLTNTATIHQHALAYVTVAKNITAITNSMIEIVVGKTETPYVTAILQTTDITDLFNQWEDYFQTWFDTVRSTLDGDVALNLQNQITSLRRETLKNTTPPIIGLPSSATPDDMFQALGNTGELHVWLKTVTTTQEQSAGYTLGDVITNRNTWFSVDSNSVAVIHYASSITVNDDAVASLVSENTIRVTNTFSDSDLSVFDVCKGKFAYISGGSFNARQSIFFIPSDAIFSRSGISGSVYISADKEQSVNTHRIIPAGTTTTYPVSPNPNAYQEGSNAKPAGYTLGEVKTGNFSLTVKDNGSITITWFYSSAVTVSDNGEILFVDNTDSTINAHGYASNAQKFKGKFCKTSYVGTDFAPNEVCFIPANASIVQSGDKLFVDRYQPVTGYAAGPAGTTIEYLGKLGDKARVQVVSYVGTGTYGSGHPNSLTFDFVPKLVIVALSKDKSNDPDNMPSPQKGWSNMFLWIYGMKMTKTSSSELHFINDGKILSWYAYNYASNQCNESGSAYTAVAIG